NGVLAGPSHVPRHPLRMSAPRSRSAPAAPARRAPSIDSILAWLGAAVCIALAIALHRRCVGSYFSPDDLVALERARGLVAPHGVPFWRVLAGSGYFVAALRVFGSNPWPWHVVSLAVHTANVALLFLLARRWSGRTVVATLAAGLFAT